VRGGGGVGEVRRQDNIGRGVAWVGGEKGPYKWAASAREGQGRGGGWEHQPGWKRKHSIGPQCHHTTTTLEGVSARGEKHTCVLGHKTLTPCSVLQSEPHDSTAHHSTALSISHQSTS
jgi:hypothetical protein